MIAKRIRKGDILIADLEELEKMDASEIYPRRVNAQEVLISQKRRTIRISKSRWYSKVVRKRLRIQRNHSKAGAYRMEGDSNGDLQGEWEKPQPRQPSDDAEAQKNCWSIQGDFIVITLNLVFNAMC